MMYLAFFFPMKKHIHKKQTLTIFSYEPGTGLLIPYIEEGINAGCFPSPAQGYEGRRINLDEELIKNPASTFIAKVDGDCLTQSVIFDGDHVIIDRSLEVRDGCKVIACIDGEFMMKIVKKGKDVIYLIPDNPDNPDYETITVTPENDFTIWGVITYSVHKHY
jgi:DNA polymerase V